MRLFLFLCDVKTSKEMCKSITHIAVIALVMSFVIGCNKPENPNDHGNDSIAEHEYVDLGLPSGTLWATCNVGANTPEDYGDYFAWGETEPKDVYDWSSYNYGDFVFERYELTKYCTDSNYGDDGFTDNLIFLELDDDAATANWGADWRMPTRDEWEELFLNTTYTITTLNGVNGCLFTVDNGNSLFLPAAGYWWNDGFNGAGIGVYWSSLINKEFPYRVWGFHINPDSSHICGSSDRCRGQSVRAVRSA